jgi:hypothetical protein
MRDVTEDFRRGRIVGDVLLAKLTGPNDGGGDEESPSAARATWTGSRLGEPLDEMGRFCARVENGWDE